MKTKTISQSITFKAGANEVYEAMMDTEKHAAFTGDEADISREIGGSFIAYGGYIEGKNLELVPGKRIVQSWRGSDWPEGHYSQVTFLINEAGGVTNLTFKQTGIPEEFYDDIYQGWQDYYWTPMKDMLER